VRICGVDFTSAPKRDKPIVVADCEADGARLLLRRFLEFADWPGYELWLGEDGAWIGGFDFPFGLPRRFVEAQRWPSDWSGMVKACVAGGKDRFAETAMRAFVAARSPQDKHRQTDLVANSHSPLKTRTNPPVGLMFYEGTWRLLKQGIRIPGLNETTSRKVALEAYPGFVVRQLRERYYKNDKLGAGTANLDARKRIVQGLLTSPNRALSCSLCLASKALREPLLHASGDWLDAVLCATQAHWAWQKRDVNFGLPQKIDSREGWIVSA
jgi:hypothetical protein